MGEVRTTYCRNCSAACGLSVEVEGDRPVKLTGDRDHPISRGYYCVKGLASLDLHNGDDRLAQSLKLGSDGIHRPVAVETALDEIHARLARIVEDHGPDAVGLYYGTGANCNSLGHSALKAWADAVGTPYIFSSMTLDQSAKWVVSARMGFYTAGKPRADEADLLMIIGSNPIVSHGSFGMPMANPKGWLREAKARGLKLIVVDPRRTETARFADIHVQIVPGTDALLFAGLIHIVLRRGWADKAFISRFATSLDALAEAVAAFTPEHVATRCGVPVEQLEEVARTFAQASRQAAFTGTGPDMGPHSNLAEHLIEAFSVLCGAYRRAGDTVRSSSLLYGGRPPREGVVPPNRTWEQGPRCRTSDIGRLGGEYPTALLPAELRGSGEDRLRALIVVGGNPVMALGDPAATIEAFGKLDLLVTLDMRATATGRLAHYQIATSLPYERHDFSGIFDLSYCQSFAQVATPIVDRPPDVIDDWEFFWGLTRRLGKPLRMKRPRFGLAQADIGGPVLELAPEDEPAAEDIVRWMCSLGELDYDELRAHPHGLLRTDRIVTVGEAREDDGARLDLCPDDVAAEIRSLRDLGDDESFPFRLASRRLLEVINSAFTGAVRTSARYPFNPAYMHPDDLAALSLAEGDRVELVSPHGKVVARVRPDSDLRRGVVSMSHCWALRPEGQPSPEPPAEEYTGNLVSLVRDVQTINFMPRQTAIPIRIIPLDPHEAGEGRTCA